MIKFILPAFIIILIALLWDKIAELLLKKFNIKLNFIAVITTLTIITIILLLLSF
tara:strand:+ start:143 stop:307 length:165 start_codon:yes stop_codon:yes gene_type:complete